MTKEELLNELRRLQHQLHDMYNSEDYYRHNVGELLDDIFYVQQDLLNLIIRYKELG